MAIYHVNPITGSDTTGNGTAVNPWLTIKFAVQSGATSGDTIKVTGTSTTNVDTAATITNPNTSIINTSVNLTSQFAVGDICIISPKYTGAPEFDGWMIYEVRAITATTIDLGNTRNPFPNASTNLFTISKFNSFVNCGASGNIEDFSTGVTVNSMAGITIVGGYDNTFTNIIGTTVYRRTGLAYNATAGSIFKPYTQGTARGDVFARFENFTVSKFADCFRNSFGASIIATNINAHGLGNLGNSFGTLYIPEAIANIYCSNTTWAANGVYANASALANTLKDESINVFINQQNKIARFEYLNINNIVGWTNTLNANNAIFSNSGLINGIGYRHIGSLSFIPLDVSRGNGFGTAVYGTGNSVMNPTSIKVVDNNATSSGANNTVLGAPLPYSFMYVSNTNDSITGPGILTLPIGTNITDFNTKAISSNTFSHNAPQMQFLNIVDGNEVWNANIAGTYYTTDTTVFDTGDSSKKILIPMKSYSGTFAAIPLYTFLKNGSINSITIRYKSDIALTGASITIVGPIMSTAQTTNITETKALSATSVWTDVIFNIDVNAKAFKAFQTLPNNMPITLAFDFTFNGNNSYTWIDSVTIS